ncbi:hypothetical protein CSUI_004332 [Cystoisospora suis]|uniref:Uncharacterized protein n=1 Tax=Cystoisospora suis TaxID=483139 RepID=A0A2C6KZ44_9APIC|nr:hypothetical protein CSUI_004332 [Cystoisospora suis]
MKLPPHVKLRRRSSRKRRQRKVAGRRKKKKKRRKRRRKKMVRQEGEARVVKVRRRRRRKRRKMKKNPQKGEKRKKRSLQEKQKRKKMTRKEKRRRKRKTKKKRQHHLPSSSRPRLLPIRNYSLHLRRPSRRRKKRQHLHLKKKNRRKKKKAYSPTGWEAAEGGDNKRNQTTMIQIKKMEEPLPREMGATPEEVSSLHLGLAQLLSLPRKQKMRHLLYVFQRHAKHLMVPHPGKIQRRKGEILAVTKMTPEVILLLKMKGMEVSRLPLRDTSGDSKVIYHTYIYRDGHTYRQRVSLYMFIYLYAFILRSSPVSRTLRCMCGWREELGGQRCMCFHRCFLSPIHLAFFLLLETSLKSVCVCVARW